MEKKVTSENENGKSADQGGIRLLDVARHAGVSRATASLVLRDSPLISKETRERVQASMEALGYVYHRGAASLRTQRSQTVWMIVPDVTNPYFAEMIVAIEDCLGGAKQVALLGNTSENFSRQDRLLEMMQEYRAGGLLLCPTQGTSVETINRLKLWRLPFVLFTRYLPEVETDYVGADNLTGMELITEHLIGLGHKHIAFIGGRVDSSARRDRLQGYRNALAGYGLAEEPMLQARGLNSREVGYNAIQNLLKQTNRPTAVVCYNDIVAFGALLGAQSLGLEPGKDIAITGFDDIAEAALWRPTLTTIAVGPRRIGEAAAALLLERIANPDQPPRQVIVPPKLVVRESSGFSINPSPA